MLHFSKLNWNTLCYTSLYCNARTYVTLQHTALQEPVLGFSILPLKNLCYTLVHCTVRGCARLWYTALQEPLLHFTTPHYNNLCYTSVHCISVTTVWSTCGYSTLRFMTIINRPGVAGNVLQTLLLLLQEIIAKMFTNSHLKLWQFKE